MRRVLIDALTSSDGTTIAFERLGSGPAVIVVGGQLADRALTRPTAEEVAQHFTAINYDRWGRGDSGDTQPYAVEREIEDLGALIAEVGGRRRCTAITPELLSHCTRRRDCPFRVQVDRPRRHRPRAERRRGGRRDDS